MIFGAFYFIMKSGKDYTGQKRAMLTFVRFDKRIGNHTYWFCKCDCGTLKSLRVSHVSEKDPILWLQENDSF